MKKSWNSVMAGIIMIVVMVAMILPWVSMGAEPKSAKVVADWTHFYSRQDNYYVQFN